jgi:hypothetical protein
VTENVSSRVKRFQEQLAQRKAPRSDVPERLDQAESASLSKTTCGPEGGSRRRADVEAGELFVTSSASDAL